jgi:nucleotide-binding universal stress UspA family protein
VRGEKIMAQIVVGFDESPESERALRWAAVEAKIRKVPLVICHVWHWPYGFDPVHSESIGIARRLAQHVLDKGLSHAQEIAPQVEIRGALGSGGAASVLLHEASGAAMIVTGTRGNGGIEGMAAGSVAIQVAGHALCPTVVARPTAHPEGPIVVGVDGSAASDAALAFACEEAILRRRDLLAVHASPEGADSVELLREAGSRLETQVAPWCTKYAHLDVRTKLAALEPREALIGAAEGASLLVVGDRGTGGIAGMRLGSVSQAMVEHAPCTVAVAHPWRRGS